MRSLLASCLVVASFGIVGCGDEKIDTSSDEAMKSSVQKVKDGLPAERREEFEKAIMTVAMGGDNLFEMAADPDGVERRMKDRLAGKTADQVFAEAEKVRAEAKARQAQREQERRAEQVKQLEGQLAEVPGEIQELQAKRKAADEARERLKGFKVERSRFYRSEGQFSRGEPVIELTVKNTLDKPIARAYFRGVLATPGRAVPWVDETFNYSISGGMEPGEGDTWKLSPNMFGEWGNSPRDRDDMVLTVEVVRVDGADGKLLADYGHRLAILARDTSPQELSECSVKSVEVYERAYSGDKSLFGKVHLHVVDHAGLTLDVPVDTSWNATNGEWQSVAEAELKLLALDRQLMQIDRAKRTLKSLGID